MLIWLYILLPLFPVNIFDYYYYLLLEVVVINNYYCCNYCEVLLTRDITGIII